MVDEKGVRREIGVGIRTRRSESKLQLQLRSPAEGALQVMGYRGRKSETPPNALVRRVRDGVAVSRVGTVADHAGVDTKIINHILKLPERTAARKKALKKPLDTGQSDRLARIARIVGLAEDVLESKDAARRWLNKPNRVLGAAPLSLLDTDIGTEQVEEILMRIEHGVYI